MPAFSPLRTRASIPADLGQGEGGYGLREVWIGEGERCGRRGGSGGEESVGDRAAGARWPSATGGSPVANPGGGGSGEGV